ncbi:MAG: EamA family transporter [Bacteroidales bacterium]|nr:EamA family transporter [Bacteroidales bacterium]
MNKKEIAILIGVNLVYACTSIFTKMASRQIMLSWPYLLWIAGAIVVMGVYALLWQQIITRMPVSTAYMFKGTSLVFVLLFSALLFGEMITITNIIGSMIIVLGIILFAKA